MHEELQQLQRTGKQDVSFKSRQFEVPVPNQGLPLSVKLQWTQDHSSNADCDEENDKSEKERVCICIHVYVSHLVLKVTNQELW